MSGPLHLKTLLPDEVRLALERDPRLLVPVGTCESHGPHLPLGCDTLIVERLADDLSADYQVLRAPTVEYGVNSLRRRQFAGNAAVRRKTLHRWMNDLIGSWEEAGVDAFIILTAHGYDPHQEALSTLRTRRARILTVDVFALDFTGGLEDPDGPLHGSELDTSLLLYVAPQLVDVSLAQNFLPARRKGTESASPPAGGGPRAATREKGERLYKMIYERIATRVLESAESAA
jgi:creatinine amidohydrolase